MSKVIFLSLNSCCPNAEQLVPSAHADSLIVMRRTVIGVMGAGENASPQAITWARQLGALIAAGNCVLLSGGRNVGVMNAVSIGANQAGGLDG